MVAKHYPLEECNNVLLFRVFEEVVPYLPKECILADISSIKGDISTYYPNSGHRFVSSHPTFGPTNADMKKPKGESAIIIKESNGVGKNIFRGFYEKIGLKLYEFSFSEHDIMMAYSLTLPFSSSMVFAACVDTKAIPGTNFRKHLELAKGILSEDDSLLSEILFNSESIKQLERITSRLEFLKHIILARDYEEAGKFFDKDTVERAFRQIKGVLDLRPVRVWLKSHIESHIKICYLAYAILAYLDFILLRKEISGGEALERLRSGYRVHLKDERSGFEWDSLVDLKKEQREIMDVVIKKT